MAVEAADRTAADERLVVRVSFGVGKTLALWLASIVVVVLGIGREVAAARAGLMSTGFGWEIFALDGEVNLPALFTAALLLLNAGLLALCHRAARRANMEASGQWLILAVGFVVLALDEALQLHELAGWAIQNAVPLSGYLSLGWVIPAVPLVLAAGLYFTPLLRRLPRDTALFFVAAGALYCFAAVGLEMLEGEILETASMDSSAYLVAMVTEESLEIAAMTLFAAALLRHLRRLGVDVRLDFR